ncbi:MAG: hypothetical protein IJ374_05000 [Lachnospiraceae bacterium]|nr:hypothetical protein [Lachnospiraceae bacterium]
MKHKKILMMAISMAVLTGCSGDDAPAFAPTESSLYITSEGTVTSATVESYDKAYYSADELKASVEEVLSVFNGDAETALATVKECTMADGTAKLLIDFNSTDSYMDFMDQYPDEESAIQLTELDVTTVSDGISKGYLVGENFYHLAKETKEVSADEVMKQSKLYVAAVEGPALIQTDGTIVYISTDIQVTSTNMVQTPDEGMSYIVFK